MRYVLSIILALLIFSCSDSKNSKNSSIDTTLTVSSNLIVAPKADSFLMQYQFTKGDKFNYKIETISSSSQELSSDSTISTDAYQNIEYKINLSVEKVDLNKIASINVLIESILINGVINGQPVTYDSKFIQSKQERMMFSQYEAIKKKHFTIDVAENGAILKIYGTNAIISELISIQEESGSINAAQKNEIKNKFSESALRPLSEQIFRKFPTEKVSTNFSWKENYYSQFALFQIENIVSFQINKIEAEKVDSIVFITAGLSINWVGENTATENGMNFYFYDPVVSGSGVIKFNKSKGLITHSETTTNMEMVTDINGIDENKVPFSAKRTDLTKNTNIIELIK